MNSRSNTVTAYSKHILLNVTYFVQHAYNPLIPHWLCNKWTCLTAY